MFRSMVNIKIKKGDFDKFSNIKKENVKWIDNDISFNLSKKDFNRISKEEIIEYHYQKNIFNFIKKHIILIIGVLIVFTLLGIQFNSIRNIIFINTDTYDQEVYDYLHEKMKKVGPFYFLKEGLVETQKELQSRFINYEWIGLNKKGSILQVEIVKNDSIISFPKTDTPGDLISMEDGYITGYNITKGVLIVEVGQSVERGQVLVTGNVLYKMGQEKYVHPTGYVYADVIKRETVEIDKNEDKIEKSGRFEEKTRFIFFDKNFINQSMYDNFETSVEIIFEIPKIFKIVKIKNYELIETNTTYNKYNAEIYGKSIIGNRFKKSSSKDKILYIKTTKITEEEDKYIIDYLVKYNMNIALFQKVN